MWLLSLGTEGLPLAGNNLLVAVENQFVHVVAIKVAIHDIVSPPCLLFDLDLVYA